MADRVQLRNFWASLASDQVFVERYKAYFAALLEGFVPAHCHTVEVWSVFGPPLTPEQRQPGVFYVHTSGEPFYHDPAAHDVSLVPDLRCARRRIAPHTLAGNHWHVQFRYFPHAQRCFDGRPRGLPLDQRAFAAFVVTNGKPQQARVRFFHKLSRELKPVHSCGRYANNVGFTPPGGEGTEAYLDFLGQFKFVLCFENTQQPWYMTEKIMNAYMAGCVPIYWGCPQARDILNPGAFLCLQDDGEAAMDDLVSRVRALDADPAAWEAMHRTPLFLDGKLPTAFEMDTVRAHIRAVVEPHDTGLS